jgi:hypothetical protein
MRTKAGPLFEHGPFRLVRRKDTGSIVIVGTVQGKRYRVTAGKDLRLAKRQLAELMFELESGWRPGDSGELGWDVIAARITGRHKWGARTRNIPFDLVPSDVLALMKASAFRCPLSGISFSRTAPVKGDTFSIRDPWAPSIDRLDNRLGYHPDNVRVVCIAANMAMNAWGYDTLLRLARGVVRNAAIASVFDDEPIGPPHVGDTDALPVNPISY